MTSSYREPSYYSGMFDAGRLLGTSYNQGNPGYGQKSVFGFDTLATERDVQAALAMQQAQLGAMGDAMYMAFGLSQLDKGNDRAEIFDYTMRGLDKQTELQNYFSNQQYGRDFGMLSGSGEQTRKNYAAQGVQDRLGIITQGEQQRLGYAALGDQNRKQLRVEGDEGRKTIRVQGDENRSLSRTEGEQQRLGFKTLGNQNRKQARVEGDEGRKTIRVQGDENRSLRRTEGRQERLNIAARGDEERQTYDSNDLIDARREERERSRARALARSF